MVALVPLGRNSLTGNTTMPMLYILQQLRSVHTPGATRFEKCGLAVSVGLQREPAFLEYTHPIFGHRALLGLAVVCWLRRHRRLFAADDNV